MLKGYKLRMDGSSMRTLMAFVCSLVVSSNGSAQLDFRQQRERLVREELEQVGITSTKVLDVIRTTDRHEFVPRAERKLAYFDMSLPIVSPKI